MNTMSVVQRRLADIPLPKLMRTLSRDDRGYPVPWIVLRDKTGRPQFTINDVLKVEECSRKGLCSICGKRINLHRLWPGTVNIEAWFAGGSRCFLHPQGAFLDPPAHYECLEYALKVCPFLAARSYSKRLDDAKLAPGALPDGMALVRTEFMQPRLPERFGFGLAFDYRRIQVDLGQTIYVVERWQYVEFWKQGEPCNAPDRPVPEDEPTTT
jgi:hypothetical protein